MTDYHPVTKEGSKQPSPRRCETCFYGEVEKEEGYGTHRYCSHPDFQYRTSKKMLLLGTEILHIQEHGCTCYRTKSSTPPKEICKVRYCGIQTGMCAFLPEEQPCPLLSRPDSLALLEKWVNIPNIGGNHSTIHMTALNEFIKRLRENPEAVRQRGFEEGWWKE